jgi:hypothetical protein
MEGVQFFVGMLIAVKIALSVLFVVHNLCFSLKILKKIHCCMAYNSICFIDNLRNCDRMVRDGEIQVFHHWDKLH